ALQYELRDAAIVELELVRDAALAAEDELHARAPDPDVAVAHRGQPVRTVRARVLVVGDADERLLEQPDDRGVHFRARQARGAQVGFGAPPDARQRARELDQPPVFRAVAHLAPLSGISVLLRVSG